MTYPVSAFIFTSLVLYALYLRRVAIKHNLGK